MSFRGASWNPQDVYEAARTRCSERKKGERGGRLLSQTAFICLTLAVTAPRREKNEEEEGGFWEYLEDVDEHIFDVYCSPVS